MAINSISLVFNQPWILYFFLLVCSSCLKSASQCYGLPALETARHQVLPLGSDWRLGSCPCATAVLQPSTCQRSVLFPHSPFAKVDYVPS